MDPPTPAPRPSTPPPPPPPPEPPVARRLSVRNTPTLRSARREQLAEAREETEAAAEPAEAPPEHESKDVKPSPARSACRKRARDTTEDDKKPEGPPEKSKRTWEKWSPSDKTVFFEALNDFGKNFQALQNYIAKKKMKNKAGQDQVRNRDQIRFFYYRTLNKISKYVQFPPDVKRSIQEIYLLVNYGELRKRIGMLNERSGQRLNELVYRGSTTVRLRGKTYRIRTPVCRALKKINRIQDPAEEPFVRLPARTQLELTPATNEAWYHVQSLSHNPRLRATLPLQYRLRTLVLALEKRWKTEADRALEKVCGDEPAPVPARRLVLRATSDYKLSAQVIRPAPPAPVVNLSFERYQERMMLLSEPPAPRTPTPQPPPAPAPTTPDCGVRLSFENVLEELHSVSESAGAGSAGPKKVSEDAPSAGAKRESACDEAESELSRQEEVKQKEARKQEEARQRQEEAKQKLEEARQKQEDARRRLRQERLRKQLEEAERRRDEEEQREEQERSRLEEERREAERTQRSELNTGWTAETAGTRTVGELYMMVNRPDTIKLQYFWLPKNVSLKQLNAEGKEETKEETNGTAPTAEVVPAEPAPFGEPSDQLKKWALQVAAARALTDTTAVGADSEASRKVKMLTSMLAQLLNVARLAKIKTETRGRVFPAGPLVTTGTQTPPSMAHRPLPGREPLYYVASGPRRPGGPQEPGARRPIPIAPAMTRARPQLPAAGAGTDAGVMRPPLETALRTLPRSNNRAGRPGRKSQVVVQRMLPLVPRNQGGGGISMVNLRLVAGQTQTAGSFVPVSVPVPVSSAATPGITISMPVLDTGDTRAPAPAPAPPPPPPPPPPQPGGEEPAAPPVLHIPERSSTPESLPPPPESEFSLNGASSDVLMDVTLANSNSSFSGFLASFGRGGGDSSVLQTPTRPLCENSLPRPSPPASPRVWSEMGDFSLSSILGHLETSKPPSKESLSDPLAMTAEELVRHTPDSFGSLDLAEVDEPAAAAPASGSSQGLPTSFQLSDLIPAACEAPLASGQSPPT
ncbi:protein cramped-like [Amphibalanus amphitrite]|uniref:protein cramped-like n=1 Tax=Amphibalanus amphitrite TaxID=1232801 RepID=UPI001C91E410|nr:protein cramped-like [Amphibalanus amphitrite]